MKTPVRPYLKVELYRTTPSVGWVDLADDILQLRFKRGNSDAGVTDQLEIGDLSMTLKGDTWSPATNANVRPGALIKVSGKDAGGTFRTLWYGRLGIPTTNYDLKHKTTVTVLPGIDVFGLASGALPLGPLQGGSMATRMDSAKLTRTGTATISRTLVGTDDSSAASFAYEYGGSILEQFQVVKDSRGGWLWASRDDTNNVMIRTSNNQPPVTPVVLTFTDDKADTGSTVQYYTDLTLSHDAESFVTGLLLNFVDGADAGSHGPYRDGGAVAAGWGRRDQEIVLTDRPYPSSSLTFNAGEFLRYRALPTVTVKSVTVDALNNRGIFTNDLIYQPVRVKNADAAHNATYHIVTEEHTLTQTSWHITYDLKTVNTVRFPTITDES